MMRRGSFRIIHARGAIPHEVGPAQEEEEELFRIVHARSAIPNEVGPTRCRATPLARDLQRR